MALDVGSTGDGQKKVLAAGSVYGTSRWRRQQVVHKTCGCFQETRWQGIDNITTTSVVQL